MRAYNIPENNNIAIAQPIFVWGPGLPNMMFSFHKDISLIIELFASNSWDKEILFGEDKEIIGGEEEASIFINNNKQASLSYALQFTIEEGFFFFVERA